jgi:hypothetical protein
LIGIGAIFFGPLYARLVTDRFVPLFSVIVGDLFCLVGIVISTYTGAFTVTGPVIQAFFNDFGMQTAQIANRTGIYAIEPKARNRVNVSFMLSTFIGQLIGTAAGNHIYAQSGWIRSGSASVGFIGASLLFCVLRGPYETGWVGWRGGWSLIKKNKHSADGRTAETTFYEIKEKTPEDVEAEAEISCTEKALEEMAAEDDGNGIMDTTNEVNTELKGKNDSHSDIEKSPI